jgi:hypothetical protein
MESVFRYRKREISYGRELSEDLGNFGVQFSDLRFYHKPWEQKPSLCLDVWAFAFSVKRGPKRHDTFGLITGGDEGFSTLKLCWGQVHPSIVDGKELIEQLQNPVVIASGRQVVGLDAEILRTVVFSGVLESGIELESVSVCP